MELDFAACAALVEKGDPDRFAALMTVPMPERAALFVLAAYNLELAKIPWVSQEPMIAEMRLQWWRDLIEGIGKGEGARAHEVAGPLHAVVTQYDLPLDLLDQMADARRWDVNKDAFEDRADFDSYIDQTAGNLMWLGALTFGATATDEAAVRARAYGAGVARFLAAVSELQARGRIPLLDGRAEGIRALASDARAKLRAAKVSRKIEPATRDAWAADKVLALAEKEPQRVADGTLVLSEFSRRFGLLRVALFGR
ncbi:squalene/phytoene synthase family protein [Halocynthiibacter sp. C4]|uniref:phytoene/squalene synthase family protein n=1 Tax=Halocynthiibacter sp. C4 TaxID=2992758 RepID=UPI00237B1265|nr:squalene/phytoene synthase family protein [Halocynthiibacter sp. C4]MDE0589722.1 squalene/phytoene synthase family protein [Halocynthiibacter sp. C4]